MKAPSPCSCWVRHLACHVLVLLYCLVAVQPQSNGERLFLVISNSSGTVKPIPARYTSISADQCSCETNSSRLITDTFQNRVNACREEYGVGVCNSVFASFSNVSYNVSVATTNQTDNLTFASREELCERVERVREELLLFQKILDRTLVCVHALTCENKTSCLNAYKEWLCATRLPLFVENDSNSQHSVSLMSTDERRYSRIKPCLHLCREVALQCPYYLPSRYQSDEPSKLSDAFVYGGHPAFACPTKDQVQKNSNSSYSTADCIGSGAHGIHSSLAGTHINNLFKLLTMLVCLVVAVVVVR